MKWMEVLSKQIECPLQIISNCFLLIITGLVFVEVISRYVFGTSHAFTEEFSKTLMVWFVYLIVGVVMQKHGHVAVDLLPTRIKGVKGKSILNIIICSLVLLFCIVVFIAGVQTVAILKASGGVPPTEFGIPLWIVALCLPIGLIFLIFYTTTDLISSIYRLRKEE